MFSLTEDFDASTFEALEIKNANSCLTRETIIRNRNKRIEESLLEGARTKAGERATRKIDIFIPIPLADASLALAPSPSWSLPSSSSQFPLFCSFAVSLPRVSI